MSILIMSNSYKHITPVISEIKQDLIAMPLTAVTARTLAMKVGLAVFSDGIYTFEELKK